ncbi:MAG: helix-turn-helix transcriptional regulator [Rhizobiales bacterium]|nr:helix-turn-helix transcriptional regulator [Hyphomicrobiales bacterium]
MFIRRRGVLLFCPSARALDRIGDRWTLLILRDLRAGPARFSRLQSGLTGIAPNLLTERFTLAASEGEMPLETFVADHVTLDVHTPGKEMELMTLLGEAMAVFAK